MKRSNLCDRSLSATRQPQLYRQASKRYPELRVLKYARSVFYNNRFDDALLEMRGLIIDAHNRIIVRPFKKSVQLFGTYCQRQPLSDQNQ